MADLNNVAAEVQNTKKCINPTILKLEHQVQIVVFQKTYSFAKYAS